MFAEKGETSGSVKDLSNNNKDKEEKESLKDEKPALKEKRSEQKSPEEIQEMGNEKVNGEKAANDEEDDEVS